MSRQLYDWHNVFGIYPFIFSLLFALTAVVFAFPNQVKAILYPLTGTPAASLPERLPPVAELPETAAMSLDEVVTVAAAAVEDGFVQRINFPDMPGEPIIVRKEWDDWNQTRNRAYIAVDQFTGEVLEVYDSRRGDLGRILVQWAIPIHFGLWGGLSTRILYVLLGLAPVVSIVTGWWKWRLRLRRKRGRKPAVVSTKVMSKPTEAVGQ